jgi:hypothetical protein
VLPKLLDARLKISIGKPSMSHVTALKPNKVLQLRGAAERGYEHAVLQQRLYAVTLTHRVCVSIVNSGERRSGRVAREQVAGEARRKARWRHGWGRGIVELLDAHHSDAARAAVIVQEDDVRRDGHTEVPAGPVLLSGRH